MKNLKRILSMFLAFVMVLGILPIQVFAAGSYGSEYPPYSNEYPNTVIVRENDGNYYAYSTKSQIYFANDSKYLMVDGKVSVRKMAWKNGSWELDGSGAIYVVDNPIYVGNNKDLGQLNSGSIEFYSITNDGIASGDILIPKKFENIVDCNINIINYNVNPVSAGTVWSNDGEIAAFGAMMMPNIYEMVTFKAGDTFESVRGDFSIKKNFTVGELNFTVDWEVKNRADENSKKLNFVDNGQEVYVEVNRVEGQSVGPIEIRGVVKYNGTTMLNAENNAPTFKVMLAQKSPINFVNPEMKPENMWVFDVDLNKYFDFDTRNNPQNTFSNVIAPFKVSKTASGETVVIEKIVASNSDSEVITTVTEDTENGGWAVTVTNNSSSIAYSEIILTLKNGEKTYDYTIPLIAESSEFLVSDALLESGIGVRKLAASVQNNDSIVDISIYEWNNGLWTGAPSGLKKYFSDVAKESLSSSANGNTVNNGVQESVPAIAFAGWNQATGKAIQLNGVVAPGLTEVVNGRYFQADINIASNEAFGNYTIKSISNDGVRFSDGTGGNETNWRWNESLTIPYAAQTKIYIFIPDSVKNNLETILDVSWDNSVKLDFKSELSGHTEPLFVPFTRTAITASPNNTAFEVDGWNLVGWESEKYNKHVFDVNLTKYVAPSNGDTLTAKYEAKVYTVTFNENKGTATTDAENMPANQDYAFTSNLKDHPIADPNKLGYTFDGWYLDEACTDANKVDFSASSTQTYSWTRNIDVYAKWTPEIWTVKYWGEDKDKNVVSVLPDKQVVFDTDSIYMEYPADGPKEPYETGWVLKDKDNVVIGEGQKINKILVDSLNDSSLKIVEIKATYRTNRIVQFNENYEGARITTADIQEGTKVESWDTPTRDGYVFKNWYANAECTGDAFDRNTPITEDIMLYAKWVSQWTVTLNYNYENKLEEKLVEDGQKAGLETPPTYDGYVFGGWYTDENCSDGNEFNIETVITANVTIYAKWLRTVVFNSNYEGGNSESICVKEGEVIGNREAPSRDGYTFEGWYTDGGCTDGNEFDIVTSSVSGNITLYAKWSIISELEPTPEETNVPSMGDIPADTLEFSLMMKSAIRMAFNGIQKASARTSTGESLIKYSHTYISLVYARDFIDSSVVSVDINMSEAVPAMKNVQSLSNGVYEIPYNEGVDTAVYSSSWIDKNNTYLGVDVSKVTDTIGGGNSGNIVPGIYINNTSMQAYYVGYVDENGVVVKDSTYINRDLRLNENQNILADVYKAINPNSDKKVRLLVYLCNNRKLDSGETVTFTYKLDDYSANVLKIGGQNNITAVNPNGESVSISYNESNILSIKTKLVRPTIRAGKFFYIEQMPQVINILNSPVENIVAIPEESGVFDWTMLKKMSTAFESVESLFKAGKHGDYMNSSYYVVSIDNPNNAPATVRMGIKGLIDNYDEAEFVGYLVKDGNNIVFTKLINTDKSGFSWEKTDFNGTECEKLALLRVSTVRDVDSPVPPFNDNFSLKVDSYTLEVDGIQQALAVDDMNPLVIKFKVVKNALSTFVDTITANSSAENNFNTDSTGKIIGINEDFGDYMFIQKMDSNDTLRDITSDVVLKNDIINATITWNVEIKSGKSVVIKSAQSPMGGTKFNVVRNGDEDTYGEFIGTVSCERGGMMSQKEIRIPFMIPAVQTRPIDGYDMTRFFDYIGGYIKDGNDVKVSVDSSNSITNRGNMKLSFSMDRNKTYSGWISSIYINNNDASKTYTNGLAVSKNGHSGINSFVPQQAGGASVNGTSMRGQIITVTPTAFNFTNVVEIIPSNISGDYKKLDIEFTEVESTEVANGAVYKTKTYNSELLFLGEYPIPDISKKYIVMDYGEYVILLTTSDEWYIGDDGGLYPGLPDGSKFVNVEAYLAPNWEKLASFNGITTNSKFGYITSDGIEASRLLYTNSAIKFGLKYTYDVEKEKDGETVTESIVKITSGDAVAETPKQNFLSSDGNKTVPTYKRAFYAPGIAFKRSGQDDPGYATLNVSGEEKPVDVYKTSDLTYVAVAKDSCYIYNATTNIWQPTILSDLGFSDKAALNGIQKLEAGELSTISGRYSGITLVTDSDYVNDSLSLLPINSSVSGETLSDIYINSKGDVVANVHFDRIAPRGHISLPNPYGIINRNNSSGLDVYVDTFGVYYLVTTESGAAGTSVKTVYSLSGFGWSVSTNNDVNAELLAANPPVKYQKVYSKLYGASSGGDNIPASEFVSWNNINIGSVPNLPAPPVDRNTNAVMVYDGTYNIFTISKDYKFLADGTTKKIEVNGMISMECYSWNGKEWSRNQSKDKTVQEVSNNGTTKYLTGYSVGDIVWSNLNISTTEDNIIMVGQSTAVFSSSNDGFSLLNSQFGGSAEKKYYIWNKTSPFESLMIKVNPESNDIAPFKKPDSSGRIELADNAYWDETVHSWRNVSFDVDIIIQDYNSGLKIGNLELVKKTETKSYQIGTGQGDMSGETITISGHSASEINILAKSESEYDTNIPNNKWFDINQKTEDLTPPIVDYGYMYLNRVYIAGHDDDSKQDTQVVSGLHERPYGIRTVTDYPYYDSFTAWQDTGDGTLRQVTFEGSTLGDIKRIPAGTTLWFDKIMILPVFNEDTTEENPIIFDALVKDAVGNISQKQVSITNNKPNQDFGIGILPPEIQKLLTPGAEDDMTDRDAPQLRYVYMYRGQLYIYAEDISVEGRDVSGLAPYPFVISSSVVRGGGLDGKSERNGGVDSKLFSVANQEVYISSPVIPIGEIDSEFTLTLKVVDAAGIAPFNGTENGNYTNAYNLTLNKFSNNKILIGEENVPDDIKRMIERESTGSGEIGSDNIPPVIHAIYVGVAREGTYLGVIATDNSGSPCTYEFELRVSGTVNTGETFECAIRSEDTGVARIYVRDKAGNETSASVFINTNRSSVVYGDPGMIPQYIRDKYNINKTDNTAPIITSVYVLNGKLYIEGYDDVGLHEKAYGWKPAEDMIITEDFVGVDDNGQPVVINAGNLIRNGTLAFNSTNNMMISIPMSFDVILRDTSDNRSTKSFFISKDNTVLYGNPPKELEKFFEDNNEDNSGLISENNGYLTIKPHGDFGKIDWNKFDYKVQLYDAMGRLVYSVETDEGKDAKIPYYVSGENVKIVESAINEGTQQELFSKSINYETADKINPVISKVYVKGNRIYVDASDNIALADNAYSFTFENVASAMEERFTSSNNRRVMAGDNVIIKVVDKSGNSSQMTVSVGEKLQDKTIAELKNPGNPIIFRTGDNKTVAAWANYFKTTYSLPDGYTLYKPEDGGDNALFEFGDIDATIKEDAESGLIQLYKDENSPLIYVSAKINNSGQTGRTAIVQKNSYSNFVLMFRDKISEEYGTYNGIDWTLETKKNGAAKEESYFYASASGKYKLNTNKNGNAIDFWFLVEDDITKNFDTIELDSEKWRYTYLVGDTVALKDVFNFAEIKDTDFILNRLVFEEISDGIDITNNIITFNTKGRKTIEILNLLNGKACTLMCQVDEPYKSIGDYSDIGNSWARAEISLLAQHGILENSNDKMFKPYNPVSIKEFIGYLDRMEKNFGIDVDYKAFNENLGVSTKDWDYYSVKDFAGMCSEDAFNAVTEDQKFNRPITRGEAARLISGSLIYNEPQRTNGIGDIIDIDDDNIETAAKHLASLGMVTITNESFRPNDELTRQEMAKMLGNLINYLIEE